jgi:hypothetical protein
VLYSFGREDQVEHEALKRLVFGIERFVSPEEALKLKAKRDTRLELKESRPWVAPRRCRVPGAISRSPTMSRSRSWLSVTARPVSVTRLDLAQVVIGLAVTREGIPIRVWTWPGNTFTKKRQLLRRGSVFEVLSLASCRHASPHLARLLVR